MNERDLVRELKKAVAALTEAQAYLARHAEANAALHCSTEQVLYSPLHALITSVIGSASQKLQAHQGEPGRRSRAPQLDDLDRCQHGRHAADPCFNCPGGQSTGNLHLKPGQRIGTGLYGDPIHAPQDTPEEPAT